VTTGQRCGGKRKSRDLGGSESAFAGGGRGESEVQSAVIEPLGALQVASEFGNELRTEEDIWSGSNSRHLRVWGDQKAQESHVAREGLLIVEWDGVLGVVHRVQVSSPDADASLLQNLWTPISRVKKRGGTNQQ
jgi:hypothetical protein